MKRLPLASALCRVVLFAGMAACSAPALAQDTYPSRPITLVVPFAAGGAADTALRAFQPALQRSLGQPVVSSNRAGAGGAIGATAVANSKADGYTLLFTFSTLATLPEQAIVNRQTPPFTLEQLLPVACITSDPVAIVVRADSPYRSAAELIAAAKAKPGEVTYASSGNYGPSHIPAAILADAAGARFNHIPYTGGAPMITSLLGGQVDFVVFSRSLISAQVESGKLLYLASYGTERWTRAPVPASLAEAGLRIDYVNWLGVFAPSQTAPEVVRRLQQALRAAAADAPFADIYSKSGGMVAYLDGPDFQQYWSAEIQQARDIIRKIGKVE